MSPTQMWLIEVAGLFVLLGMVRYQRWHHTQQDLARGSYQPPPVVNIKLITRTAVKVAVLDMFSQVYPDAMLSRKYTQSWNIVANNLMSHGMLGDAVYTGWDCLALNRWYPDTSVEAVFGYRLALQLKRDIIIPHNLAQEDICSFTIGCEIVGVLSRVSRGEYDVEIESLKSLRGLTAC